MSEKVNSGVCAFFSGMGNVFNIVGSDSFATRRELGDYFDVAGNHIGKACEQYQKEQESSENQARNTRA